MKILLINACTRPKSRTLKLAKHFIEVYKKKNSEDEFTELRLYDEKELTYLDRRNIKLRNELIEKKQWDHPMFKYANEFAQMDRIIVAAPYWDLAFPAILKVYLENIFVCGITFAYDENGEIGLCNADKLLYITTAGGPLHGMDLGKQYIEAVCKEFGIDKFDYLLAEGLDVKEWDTEKILNEAISEAQELSLIW
ncbi:NAD(P)H-dependent oxidoreductase [Anaerovorax odorimutans]|uniref:NAD(P)H-dependent oxidoreductase n=1 Tax=Anaerovorax odorimutans TaxID=109327 RepID=UPI00041A5791|nr:NAD(P)H-dependent oxidoreductase [Anaerovorax odorimutans]